MKLFWSRITGYVIQIDADPQRPNFMCGETVMLTLMTFSRFSPQK